MRYIIALFIIMILPIYLIAKDQIEQKLGAFADSSIRLIADAKKTTNPPITLSDDDKKSIEDIKNFTSSLPQTIIKELRNFNQEKKKLNEHKKKLYQSLSPEAKKALSKEASLKKKLSLQAKKALIDESENN